MVQRRDASQVVSFNPPASSAAALTGAVWMGELGHVSSLKYASSLPGGPSTASWVLQRPPTYRVSAMTPGRWIQIVRGCEAVWQGVLQEPQPGTGGWQMSAVGIGSLGNNYRAIYTSWNPAVANSNPIDMAIARGMRWRKGTMPSSGLWLGDFQDSGSCTVSDYLNSITVQGGMIWKVDRRDGTLTIVPLPATVNRLLVSNSPVPRTVAEDVNSLFLRYQATDDNSSATPPVAATYGLANVTDAADIAQHGTAEEYYDLSQNGTMALSAAQSNGNNILNRYNGVTFSSSFTITPGQLLNAGGAECDPGTEAAGNVYRLMLTDFGYAADQVQGPVTIIGGDVEWDDTAQQLQVTAFLTAAQNFGSLLSAAFPTTSTPG